MTLHMIPQAQLQASFHPMIPYDSDVTEANPCDIRDGIGVHPSLNDGCEQSEVILADHKHIEMAKVGAH